MSVVTDRANTRATPPASSGPGANQQQVWRRRSWVRMAKTLRNQFVLAALISLLVFVLSAILFWLFERGPSPDVSGIGSGFVYAARALLEGGEPWAIQTGAGRVLHEFIIVGGRSIFALATGAFAAKVVEVVVRKGSGMDATKDTGHIVICGWSSKGSEIIRELQAKEVEDLRSVVILAPLSANPSRSGLTSFVNGNPTSTEDLLRAGIDRAETAIILADDTSTSSTADEIDANTLLTTLAVEALNPTCHTCVEVIRSENRAHFERTKADELVVSAELTGALLASSARTHGLSRIIADLITHPTGAEFYTIAPPAGMIGRTFSEAVTELKARHDVLLAGVVTTGGQFQLNPPSQTSLTGDGKLLVIANGPPDLT
jgi:voltage-gated potassium channel